jgi:hypothetical protein
MEKKYFLLEPKEESRIVRIFQAVFGIFCIIIAIFWLVFNIRSGKIEGSLWITVIFLAGFGAYQILAGLGKTNKYFETGPEKIVLKQNSFLPKIEIKAVDLEAIEIFPLSIIFRFRNKKKIIYRFGLSNTEIINPIKDEILEFSGLNSIPAEEKKEVVL